MERRNALKSMAMLIGGAIALPEWANGWSTNSLTTQNWLRPNLASVLSEAVETIIPKTNTPGAKDLGLDTFVQKMIVDCYSKEVQSAFAKGIGQIDAVAQQQYSKPFTQLDTPQRIELLKGFEKGAETKDFYGLLKGLTVRGYLNSEYVMTNITHYEMVPGRYHGCIKVK